MEWVKLGDVVEVQKGKKVSESEHNTGLRYIQIEDLRNDNNIKFTDQENSVKVNANDVLLAWDGANAGISSYGLEGIIGSTLARIRVKEKYSNIIKSEYLGLFLQYNENYLRNTANGATIPHVNRGALLNLKLNNVSLEYQQKVITLMSNISNLISIRKAQIAALDELVQSVFYEMFGNSKFIHYSFSELVKIDTKTINDFTSLKDEFYIGVENIEKNTGNLIDFIKVGDADIKSSKNLFNENHILYSKIRPNLNKVAIPNFSGVTSTDIFPLLPSSKINKMYLTQILRGKTFLDYAILNSSGANIPRINKTILNNFQIPLPPLELQEQFAAKVEAIEAQTAKLQASLEEMETLFDALMQEAFSGNLG